MVPELIDRLRNMEQLTLPMLACAGLSAIRRHEATADRACPVIVCGPTEDDDLRHRFVFSDLGDFETREKAEERTRAWVKRWIDENYGRRGTIQSKSRNPESLLDETDQICRLIDMEKTDIPVEGACKGLAMLKKRFELD